MAAVVGTLGEMDIPQAQRVERAGWRDPRLWIGVALVAVSVVVGARVVGGSDDSVGVWAVREDLAPGAEVAAADLVEKRVSFVDEADAARYLRSSDGLPVERHLTRAIGAGELVPRHVLGKPSEDVVQVAVSLPAAQVPPHLRPGSLVDLWSAPRSASSSRGATPLVGDVVVVQAPEVSADLVGAAVDRQVVLAVPRKHETVSAVIAASGAGELMVLGRR